MWKRAILITECVVLALVAIVGGYYFSGSSAIESWIGTQILAMGGSYLEPDLRFKKLTYVRPRTVLLDELTLTSQDPADRSKMVVIFSVKHARLELTEIPRRGEPLRFTEIILDTPEIHAMAVKPGDGRLLGFSNFVRESGGPAKPESSELAEPLKLSDVLRIRHVEIINGTVRYDSRQAGMPPLWLDGIHAKLELSPADTATRPGVYTVATTISRKPAIDIALNGQLNVDTFELSPAKVEMTVDVQEKNAHFLPSELQNLLKEFEVNGQLHTVATGSVPLLNTNQMDLQCQAELTDARIAVGKHRVAVESWLWDIGVKDGVATIRKGRATTLGGQLGLTGAIPFDGDKTARLEVIGSNLQIQKLLRTANPDEPPEYAGNVAMTMMYQAPLAQWNSRARGGGEISVRQGRLSNVPVLGEITRFISSTISRTLGGKPSNSDSADATFSFVNDRVVIHQFSGTSGAIAMRGDGTVGFDRQLDLRLNAGPMERLQNSLGALGRAWASITDSVAGYRVTGTLSDPQVSVEVGR